MNDLRSIRQRKLNNMCDRMADHTVYHLFYKLDTSPYLEVWKTRLSFSLTHLIPLLITSSVRSFKSPI